MEADWGTAIEFVLKMEGGEVDDPNDPGGHTKFGISQKAYPKLDISKLTLQDAKDIYKRDYWDICKCSDLHRPFAIATMDMAVNMGVGRAKRTLQIALNVEVDGIIGPKTIEASHRAPEWRVKKFLALRLAEYTKIIHANDRLMVFVNNWTYRVISLAEVIFGEKRGIS